MSPACGCVCGVAAPVWDLISLQPTRIMACLPGQGTAVGVLEPSFQDPGLQGFPLHLGGFGCC